MENILKSRHTQLFIAIGAAEVIKVTRARAVGFSDGQTSEIDISGFDDDWDQFVAGRGALGSTSVVVMYDSVASEALEGPQSYGAAVSFLITARASKRRALPSRWRSMVSSPRR